MVRESLSSGQDGVVYGVSSRGMFIKTGSQRVIYLTKESFKGPLTVNLNAPPAFQKDIKPGSAVFLKPENILIPAAGLDFNLSNAREWEPALPAAHLLSRDDQARNLKLLAQQVLRRMPHRLPHSYVVPYSFTAPVIAET